MPESKQPTKQPTSDAFGANAWLVDEMFEQFRRDPLSVSESWREFFEGYKPAGANLAGRAVLLANVQAPADEVAQQTADGPRTGNGASGGVATLVAPPIPPAPTHVAGTVTTPAAPPAGPGHRCPRQP